MEPNSEIKLVRVSEGTFRARFLMRNSEFDLVCLLVYGIPTFDSESFELELNGRAWDTSGSSFVQIPSVFLEIRFQLSPHVRCVRRMWHERTVPLSTGVFNYYRTIRT